MTKIRPLEPRIAAEVTDVDVKQLDDVGFAPIYQAFLDHNVLVVRDQDLGIEDFIAYSRRFGIVVPHLTKKSRHPDFPELTVMDNAPAPGKAPDMVVVTRGMGWHTDLTFEKVAAKATQLYGIAIPSRGGDTLFANMYAVYEALPQSLKDRVADLKGTYRYGGRGRDTVQLLNAEDQAREPALHPFVRTHPETGRTALYVDPLNIGDIVGCTREECDALMAEIVPYIERAEFRYRHKWRKGDIVIWDNRCSVHSATGDYPLDERRALWRCTIMDPPNIGRLAAE